MRLVGAGIGAAAILLLRNRLRTPPRPDVAIVVSVALVRLALPYGLVMSALLFVPPGRSSVLVHTEALWAVPVGILVLHEYPSRWTLVGLAISLTGILLLMEPWSFGTRPQAFIGYSMLIGAAVATAIATVHIRGHRWSSPTIDLMPWQMLLAAAITVPMAYLVHGLPTLAGTVQEISVIGYQIVLATGFALWGTLMLARSLPAVATGMLFMAVPVVGFASSVILVGETVSPVAMAGALLVLGGLSLKFLSGARATGVHASGTGASHTQA